jgi:uncharacterized membrane protein YcaP (DUF421 family)
MHQLFQNSYIQIMLRSLAVYLFVIIALKLFGKKELAQLSVIDLVFILLISNSVQNAMVGPDTSLTGGLLAAVSLFSVNYLLKQLLFKNPKTSEWLQGKAVMLVYKGEVQEANLNAAEITRVELEAAVREHGIMDIQNVDLAMIEVDGSISVISNDFKTRTVKSTSSISHKRKHRLKGKIK